MFETVVDSHVVGVRKPEPGIFEIALERLKLAPERAVYLGDIPRVDVVGARAAGIAPILFDRHEFYDGVDAPRIRRLDELPSLIGSA